MLSDTDLRRRLTAATAHLAPDLEAELEAVFRRARIRRDLRWGGYAVGMVAAVVVLVLAVAGLGWFPQAAEPAPAEPDTPVRTLTPQRGVFDVPAPVEPGVWRVRFLDHRGTDPFLLVDVPAGWGQDDDVALSTGSPKDLTTRRLELTADLVGVYRSPCGLRTRPAGDTALAQAQALAAIPGVQAGPVKPATLDGHPGYQVRLHPPAALPRRGGACAEGMALLFRSQNWPMFLRLGWTALVRLVDVDGHVLVVTAVHGPEASEADLDELARMVDTARLGDP